MSLVSAPSLLGGIKEYTFRGIQQLPLVLTATSLLFTVTTGSISHLNLTLGLGLVAPIYTFISSLLVEQIFQYLAPTSRMSWTRATSDTCSLVPPEGPKALSAYESRLVGGTPVPSYWLMSVGLFIGYCISNAVDILTAKSQNDADPKAVERRNWQAIFIIAAVSLLSGLLLFIRFWTMRGCEGRGWIGITVSLILAGGAAGIGSGMYYLSKACGARTSDLFGVLSQFVPSTAVQRAPVVCALEES